jgi:2'-5' RNA ligase
MSTEGSPLQLFFGIFPDAEARVALATIARAAKRDTGGRSPRPERIHLTLLYLGLTDPAKLDEVLALAAGVRLPSFELQLTSLEWWRKNSIVCATPEDKSAVTALARALTLQLGAAGFKSARNEFAPHVTLVREAEQAPPENMAPVAWTVRRFRLVHSVVDWSRSRYELLGEFPLTD